MFTWIFNGNIICFLHNIAHLDKQYVILLYKDKIFKPHLQFYSLAKIVIYKGFFLDD